MLLGLAFLIRKKVWLSITPKHVFTSGGAEILSVQSRHVLEVTQSELSRILRLLAKTLLNYLSVPFAR